MRVLSRSYRIGSGEQLEVSNPVKATAGWLLFGLAMAGSSLAGAVFGGASEVVERLPAWFSDGGVGAAVGIATILVISLSLGRLGLRIRRGNR